jgi:hypothetical protein
VVGTVIVSVNVVEGTRKRVQAYEGVVIAKRNRGLNSSFIVRKISSGEGVERTFQLYSPLIASIEGYSHGLKPSYIGISVILLVVIGTLFVPQTLSTPEEPHSLVNAFLEAVTSAAE